MATPDGNCDGQPGEDEGMVQVILLINKLQDVVASSNLPSNSCWDLPQMAVVGEQSAGKSSVLENIIGKDFLPRGTGIVTRCPLVLQLIHSNRDYVEFMHKPDVKFTDFEEVKKEIIKQTDKIAGHIKSVTNKAINLRIYSPDVPHLTLIDLPGLTKVPVQDQPENIEEIIKDLVLTYIRPKNTLILAVTTATQDLANSDALRLAQEVDPNRERTIGVITKLDLMDSGTDARDVLQNKVVSLKRGYVGLINRSQDDINQKRDMKTAHEKELKYYKEYYSELAHKMGSKYLRKLLSQQLCEHIRLKLPDIRSQVQKENDRVRYALEAMAAFDECNSEHWYQMKLIELIQKFGESFTIEMEGLAVNVSIDELSGGSRLNDCFYTEIYHLLEQKIFSSKEELFMLWRKMVGFRNAMSFTQQAFDNIIRKYLKKFKIPLNKSSLLSAKILRDTVHVCLKNLEAFPNLVVTVKNLMLTEIDKNEAITRSQLRNYLKAQKAFMNVYHPDFMKQPHLELRIGSVSPAISEVSLSGESVMNFNEAEINFPAQELIRGQANAHVNLGTRTYTFVLTSNALTWFKSDSNNDPKGSIMLDELKVELTKSKSKGKKFSISKRGSKKPPLIITFKKETENAEWLAAFSKAGINVAQDEISSDQNFIRQGSTKSKTSHKSPMNSNFPSPKPVKYSLPGTAEGDIRRDFSDDPILQEVCLQLQSYSEILSESIKDMTPKFIVKFLVLATLKYTKLRLLSDIQKEEAENLMQISEEDLDKRNEYFRVFHATENALKILGEGNFVRNSKRIQQIN